MIGDVCLEHRMRLGEHMIQVFAIPNQYAMMTIRSYESILFFFCPLLVLLASLVKFQFETKDLLGITLCTNFL